MGSCVASWLKQWLSHFRPGFDSPMGYEEETFLGVPFHDKARINLTVKIPSLTH